MSVERLSLLLKVSDARTANAARELGQRQDSLNEQRRRLEELSSYLGEYRGRSMPHLPALIANSERFLARLGEAEVQQRRSVAQAEETVQHSTRCWVERRRDGEKFQTLQAAAMARTTSITERRAQQGMDEFALRDFTARRAALGE
ncbi:MAG: flagellar export protein FliJ [Panacagrimonas sp.]